MKMRSEFWTGNSPRLYEFELTEAEELHYKLALFRSWFPPWKCPAHYMDAELEALVCGHKPERYTLINGNQR